MTPFSIRPYDIEVYQKLKKVLPDLKIVDNFDELSLKSSAFRNENFDSEEEKVKYICRVIDSFFGVSARSYVFCVADKETSYKGDKSAEADNLDPYYVGGCI